MLAALNGDAPLGLAMVALIEFRDTTFRTEQDILTVLALPVLATVPAILTAAERRSDARRRLITACISVSFLLLAVTGAAWKFRSVLMWWR